MIGYFRHIISIIVFLSVAFVATGRDSLEVSKVYHDIRFDVSAGYNLPSHGYFNGYNPLDKPLYFNSLAHLKYGFGFQPGTRLGELYPGVTQGVGLSVCTFYSKELMGNPLLLYIYQNGPLYEIKPGFSVDYNWEFGGSYGWTQSELIATRANIYINVGLMLSWDLGHDWKFSFGPEFSHFSNGDTKFPNGGANLFNLKFGVTSHLAQPRNLSDRRQINEYNERLRQNSFADRIEYDLIVLGGWRAGKVIDSKSYNINEVFPFFAVNFIPMYRIDRYFSAGASLDLLADRSANLYDVVYDRETKQVMGYSQPGLDKQIAAGLSLRGDITLPVFTIGAGFGGFVVPAGKSLTGLYTVFSLKTFVTKSLFMNITYRLSAKNYTHNMMYGMGVRF